MKIDARLVIGGLFIGGYYATIWIVGFSVIPETNVALVKDAMLQLGPPVGAIVAALFRTDRTDELRAENSGKGFDAVKAQAQSNTPPAVTVAPDATSVSIGTDGDPEHQTKE